MSAVSVAGHHAIALTPCHSLGVSEQSFHLAHRCCWLPSHPAPPSAASDLELGVQEGRLSPAPVGCLLLFGTIVGIVVRFDF